MLGHVLAVIPGQGSAQRLGQAMYMARQSGQNVLGLVVGDFDQGGLARVTLYQRDDLAALRTAQQIPLPVTRNGSVFGLGGTLSHRDRLGDLAAQILAGTLARIAEASPSTQMLDELFFQHPASLNEQALVDRFMRYLHALIAGVSDLQPSRDLLGRPLEGQFTRHDVAQPVVQSKPAGLGPKGRQ